VGSIWPVKKSEAEGEGHGAIFDAGYAAVRVARCGSSSDPARRLDACANRLVFFFFFNIAGAGGTRGGGLPYTNQATNSQGGRSLERSMYYWCVYRVKAEAGTARRNQSGLENSDRSLQCEPLCRRNGRKGWGAARRIRACTLRAGGQ
jgi:hypothetical protein